MSFARSHLVLAAAVVFAALAGVQLLRGGETPAPPAPEEHAQPSAAAPAPVAAAPPEQRESPRRVLLVQGRITNPRGGPVPGARIAVRGSREEDVSDASGAYAIRVAPGEAAALRFAAAGYQDAVVALDPAQAGEEALWLDVRLEPAPGAVVSGTLRSERGAPIAGETIQLASGASEARYAGVSDAQGGFLIPGVAAGSSYYLSVRPQGDYADFQRPLAVGPEGVSLDITLRELSTTRLHGRLVDPAGEPIPNLAFSVVSGQALGRSLAARSDADGYFALEDVPTGHLSLLAEGQEPLVVSGLLLPPGADGEVVVRADWGSEALSGRVVGGDGRSLGGAEVELSWSHVDEDAAGRSNRTARTDADGRFEFRRLGSGVHRLEVRAPGHRPVEVDYDVTPQSPGVLVELEPARGAG